MATSSITRNFIVEGEEQAEIFANAIEESWQESLTRKEERLANFHFIETAEELDEFTKKWNETHGYDE